MDHLNWGYVQLALLALAFGGLQIWWIGNVLLGRRRARPIGDSEFRKALEAIWAKRP